MVPAVLRRRRLPVFGPVPVGAVAGYRSSDPTVVRRIAAFPDAGLRTGALRPTVDRVLGLDAIVAAHEYLEQGHQVGKIVVTV